MGSQKYIPLENKRTSHYGLEYLCLSFWISFESSHILDYHLRLISTSYLLVLLFSS